MIDLENIDYFLIPEHMRDGMRRYLESGTVPGNFLTSVLCNDLKGAVCSADRVNMTRLPDYVNFLYNNVPESCWGSVDKIHAWSKARQEAWLKERHQEKFVDI